jgi:hypothetical protein
MTEKQLRQKPVDWLEKRNGCKKGSEEHKGIIKTFNDSGLCERYKMTVNDPWCATAASAAMIAVGLASIFPCVECSCSAMIEKAKKAKIWQEKDNYVPKTGDKVLYDWDDNGKGDCNGAPEHVGTVVSVKDGTIDVIEGNIGAGVMGHRKIAVNGRYIRGFITPDFAKLATKEKPTLEKKGYKKGDATRGVLAMKELLALARKKKIIKTKVDENKTFGDGTQKAVNELLKKWGYKQTGIAGEKFIKKLKSELAK